MQQLFTGVFVLFAIFFQSVICDKCDTDTHPTLGVKGQCIEKSDCLSMGGVYEDNWCMSKSATVKCCFFEPEIETPIEDNCELPEPEKDFCSQYTDPFMGKGSCMPKSDCTNGIVVEDWCEASPTGYECCFSSQNADNPCSGGGQFYPHKSPFKFIQCAHGWPFIFDCPAGQVWHQDKKWCDVPDDFLPLEENLIDEIDLDADSEYDNLGGGIDTSTGSESINLSTDRCDTQNHPDFGRGSCKEMSSCTGVYVNNWCESKAASVKCCFENISWDNICSRGGQLYPHKDPSKFIQCAHGWPFVMSCPAGQIWISERYWCDYP